MMVVLFYHQKIVLSKQNSIVVKRLEIALFQIGSGGSLFNVQRIPH